jgi:lipopolysaccharide/colanic/teichoic acid biosynthesis glycosyltransferase
MPTVREKSVRRFYKVKNLVSNNYLTEIALKHPKKIAAKKLCLIINPGILAKKLIQKKEFNQKFNYNFWNNKLDNQLIKYLKKNNYDYIIVDEINETDNVETLLSSATFHDIDAKKIFSINSFFQKKIEAASFVYNADMEHDAHLYIKTPSKNILATKRCIDILLSILILPIALPLCILAIIFTKISSKGPAIFKQKRVGQNGSIFTIYKIRTMTHGVKNNGAFTVKNDARITGLGKILRKTKIDELPQILNVLKGDMSWVGPRPERADIVAYYEKHNQFYKYRHLVKPGITGWAQVKFPTATPNENLEKLEYDLYYINHLNYTLDCKVFLKTLGVISTLDSL